MNRTQTSPGKEAAPFGLDWTQGDSAQRFIDALPAAVYATDALGRVTMFNRAAAELWGREPTPGLDLWCGSWKTFHPDGLPMPADECPMAVAIRERRPIRGREIIIECPDGVRRHVLPHPDPVLNTAGELVGATNMLVDITERRKVEQTLEEREAQLRAVLDQAATGIALVDKNGRFLEVNQRLCGLVGLAEARVLALTDEHLSHPDDRERNRAAMAELTSGRVREFSIEKRYRRGTNPEAWVWVNVTFSALLDKGGGPDRMVGIVEDITQRKEFREEMHRQVEERTGELERAQSRLRETERLTALGTLSAGLGHDLANLLLPLRSSLDALESPELADKVSIATEIGAMRRGLDYLHRLSSGLRLMVVNTANKPTGIERTELGQWWGEIEGVLRAVLLRGAVLEARIPPDIPPVAIGRAPLAQAIFNLVQNAGEAMAGQAGATVTVSAAYIPARRNAQARVDLVVSDNGPGMTADTLSRCFEPYFSTKSRAIATGLGLPLVRSTVMAAGGTVTCESDPGRGSRFILALPTFRADRLTGPNQTEAMVTLVSSRSAALAAAVLDALGVKVVTTGAVGPSALWIARGVSVEKARLFLENRPRRCIVLWEDPESNPGLMAISDGRIIFCGPAPDTATMQGCFEKALRRTQGRNAG